MESRVKGIQKKKAHLYQNVELLSRDDFKKWANSCEELKVMFKIWEESNYNKKLCPSIDRIDSLKGYTIENMRWLTHSENSRLGAISDKRKVKIKK